MRTVLAAVPHERGLAALLLTLLDARLPDAPPRHLGEHWDAHPVGDDQGHPYDAESGLPLRILLGPGDVEMAWVPAGPVPLGADPDAGVAGQVTHLQGFYLGRFPVRPVEVARLKRIHARGVVDDAQLERSIALEGEVAWPAAWISYEVATFHARSLGGRLPTEAEWERAARGEDPRPFPWGEDPADMGRIPERFFRYPPSEWADFPAALGRCPAGASPFGVEDLLGNVFEWCADPWKGPGPEPTGTLLTPEDAPDAGRVLLPGRPGGRRVQRGGFTRDRERPVHVLLRRGLDEGVGGQLTGLRLARSVLPPALDVPGW